MTEQDLESEELFDEIHICRTRKSGGETGGR